MSQHRVNKMDKTAVDRLSIYDMMFFDAISIAGCFGMAILLGVISLGKGLGGVVLCGSAAAGIFVYRGIVVGASAEDQALDNDPRALIARLGEALLRSSPGDVSLSGIVIALELACQLEGKAPESHDAMLKRLNYGILATAYEGELCVSPDDVLNARQYYTALLCADGKYRPAQREDEVEVSSMQAGDASN